MNKLILIGSHLLVGALAAYCAVYFLGRDAAEPRFLATPNQVPQVSAPRVLQRPEVVETVVVVDPDTSIFSQQYAAHQLAAQSDVFELTALMDEYLRSNDPLGTNLSMIFLERLMELDMHAAVGYAENAPVDESKRQQLIGSVLTTWARYDANAAVNYLVGMYDRRLQYQIARRLFQDPIFRESGYLADLVQTMGPEGEALLQQVQQAAKSPSQQLQEALSERSSQRQHMLSLAIANWYHTDVEGALNALANLDSEADRRSAVQYLVHIVGRRDPFAAYDLVIGYAPEADDALVSAINKIMRADPLSGLPLLEQHYAETGNTNLLSQGLSGWASTDVAGVIAYLDSVPAGVKRNVAMSISHQYAQQDPEGAMDWAVSSNDQMIQQMVARAIAGFHPETAETWLRQTENEQLASVLLNSMASARTHLHLDDTLAWLSRYEDLPGYDQAYAQVLGERAQINPVQVADYLTDHIDDEAYAGAFTQTAMRWGYNDHEAALDWVDDLPDSPNRTAAAKMLVQSMMGQNPKRAVEVYKQLIPDGDSSLGYSLALQLAMTGMDVDEVARDFELNDQLVEKLRQNVEQMRNNMSYGGYGVSSSITIGGQ